MGTERASKCAVECDRKRSGTHKLNATLQSRRVSSTPRALCALSAPSDRRCRPTHLWQLPGLGDSPHAPTRSQPHHPPTTPSPPLALKEWAILCAALASGESTVLLRRGGVRDRAGFIIETPRFLLLPTSHHADTAGVEDEVATAHAAAMTLATTLDGGLTLTIAAEVTGAWVVADAASVATATRPFHRLSDAGVAARLKGHEGKPITLVEVRAFELRQPVVLPPAAVKAVAGCRAWADLATVPGLHLPPSLDGATPCMTDDVFAVRAARLRAVLARAATTSAELDVGALGSRDD